MELHRLSALEPVRVGSQKGGVGVSCSVEPQGKGSETGALPVDSLVSRILVALGLLVRRVGVLLLLSDEPLLVLGLVLSSLLDL